MQHATADSAAAAAESPAAEVTATPMHAHTQLDDGIDASASSPPSSRTRMRRRRATNTITTTRSTSSSSSAPSADVAMNDSADLVPPMVWHVKQSRVHAVRRAVAQLGWLEHRSKRLLPALVFPSTANNNAANAANAAAASPSSNASSPRTPLASSPQSDSSSPSSPPSSSSSFASSLRSSLSSSSLASHPSPPATSSSSSTPAHTDHVATTAATSSSSPRSARARRTLRKDRVPPPPAAPWTIAWLDDATDEIYKSMQLQQRVNQIPDMEQLTRKRNLALHLNAMKARVPQDYSFVPRSWVLPKDYSAFLAFHAEHPVDESGAPRVYIKKPDSSCEGKGIVLFTSTPNAISPSTAAVVQEYLSAPYLVNERKFDLRIYALVTSISPLEVYMYRDGLTRFCTRNYTHPLEGSLDDSFAHLTNYAVNKKNKDFQFNTDAEDDASGSKWSLQAFFDHLTRCGHDAQRLHRQIADIVLKTVISAAPSLAHAFRAYCSQGMHPNSCFQLLGFDILLDAQLNPWIMEVNRNPSLRCDTPLDTAIKQSLVSETLQMMNPRAYAPTRAQVARDQHDRRFLSALELKAHKESWDRNLSVARSTAEFEASRHSRWQRVWPPAPSLPVDPAAVTSTTSSSSSATRVDSDELSRADEAANVSSSSSSSSLASDVLLFPTDVYERLLDVAHEVFHRRGGAAGTAASLRKRRGGAGASAASAGSAASGGGSAGMFGFSFLGRQRAAADARTRSSAEPSAAPPSDV